MDSEEKFRAQIARAVCCGVRGDAFPEWVPEEKVFLIAKQIGQLLCEGCIETKSFSFFEGVEQYLGITPEDKRTLRMVNTVNTLLNNVADIDVEVEAEINNEEG